MRIDNEEHVSHPWRIQEVTGDFELEDVWQLPVEGGVDDFPELLEVMASLDPANGDSRATKALWQIRDLMGRWFGLGRTSAEAIPDDSTDPLPIPGRDETTLKDRLPEDLQGTADDPRFGVSGPFSPLFFTGDEFAAEISNQTVHGVLHLAWLKDGDEYTGQMAVYVKPRGRLGKAYMELIKPFRHLIVYPAMMRQIEKSWNQRPVSA